MIIPKASRLNNVREYYFVKKLEEIARLNKEGKDIISFGIGSPDMAPDESVIQTLYDTASKKNTHGYQPYRGIPELREGIASFYKNTYGVALDPHKEVLPLMGSKEGILHVSMAFLNPGDEVLVPNPGYPTYSSLSNLTGAKVRYYDLTESSGWQPDLDALESSDLSSVKIMWLNYPHMPTGTPGRMDVLQKLVDFARKNNILLCYDNPYSLVLNEDKPVSILAVPGAKDVAVEFNSLSKSHNMAGWRLGMVLGAEDYLSTILTVKSNIDSGMFLGLQKAAITALGLGEQWHKERNESYKARREVVFKILDLLGFEYDTSQVGMFIWCKPSPEKGIDDIAQYIDKVLYEANVFFTPGFIFGSNGDGYMRASLCVPLERMNQAYDRLVAWKKKDG
ncbi:aminotransferase class I/II-fold pyridoxal phosphate-dependent enzyme [Cytophagaceae bacterium ABcell3]|nr:aminotransferase class I/II-fold pyridoxal phosphate-dependent enzyme [Cytophagaceae bacterium ABcell3]